MQIDYSESRTIRRKLHFQSEPRLFQPNSPEIVLIGTPISYNRILEKLCRRGREMDTLMP